MGKLDHASPSPGIDRRTLLGGLAAGAILAPGFSAAADEPKAKASAFPGLITRQKDPDNLEFPFASLNSFITPNEQFFVRTHFEAPEIAAKDWKLKIEGAVEKPAEIGYDELRQMPSHKLPALLECSGNGRVFLKPPQVGVRWEFGAVSTAEWTGVRLADVLERAGVKQGAVGVILEGADKGEYRSPLPPTPGAIHFARSLPLAKARKPEVLLAYQMNGKDLPPAHGFPVRAVVPGWYGMASIKWLTRIIVTETPFRGYFQTFSYTVWQRRHGEPTLVPVTEAQVKAQIARPMPGEAVSANSTYRVFGAAWAGETDVVKVEFSADGGKTWQETKLTGEKVPFAWRFWEFEWKTPGLGKRTLMARATDARGQSQPMKRDPDRRDARQIRNRPLGTNPATFHHHAPSLCLPRASVKSMTGDISLGRIFGIPFRLHWSWFLAVALIAWTLSVGYFPMTLPEHRGNTGLYWGLGIAAALGLFISVLLHEMGHAVAARRYGIQVRGIRLFIFGGVAELGGEAKRPGQEIVIAIAGPAVTLALLVLFHLGSMSIVASTDLEWRVDNGILLGLSGGTVATAGAAALLSYLGNINLMLLLFNMVPAFPLDGGRVFRGIVWAASGNYLKATRVAGAVGIGFSYLMFVGGFFFAASGNLIGGLWLFFLGMFLQNAARSSIAYAQLQEILSGVKVAEVMNPQPIAVDAHLTLREAVEEFFLHYPHKAYPVVDDGRFAGILTLRDVQEAGRDRWDFMRVGELVARQPPLPELRPGDPLLQAVKLFAESDQSRLPVIDDGRLVGLLCARDVMDLMEIRAGLTPERRDRPPQSPRHVEHEHV